MKKKVLSSILVCTMLVTMGTKVHASIRDDISYAQAQKAQAQASLQATQSEIYSLQNKKAELESYLGELNEQYNQLERELTELITRTKAKEDELVAVKAELKQAQIDQQEQYEAMKIRIAYMYERGGSNALIVLLSSNSFADFLNRTENILALSEYDRNMLKKFEETCRMVEQKEKEVEEAIKALETLQQETMAKQQEVQSMVESTKSNIQSYINQISATQQEASYLMAEVNRADRTIYNLLAAAAAQSANNGSHGSSGSSSGGSSGNSTGSGSTTDNSSGTSDSSGSSDSSGGSSDTAPPEYDSGSSGDMGSGDFGDDVYIDDDMGDFDYVDDDLFDSFFESTQPVNSAPGTYLGNFKLTGYCNCAKCCGTAGNATASGVYPTAYHTVAMAGVPFGTQLMINGSVYTVEDLGTPYGHVDIYFNSHEEALNFGLQYADVYQLN